MGNPYVLDENNVDRYPLIEPWLSQLATIVDPFYGEMGPFKDLLYNVEDCLEDAGYSTSVIRNNDVTVEWLRDGLSHEVVLWRGHSVHFPSGIGLLTGEIVDEENTLKYKEDIENNRIGSISKSSKDYWAIRPEFIEYYYQSNGLQGSLVVVAGCKSLVDNSLAEAFVSAGAGAYVGYIIDAQEPIVGWNMLNLFTNLCNKGYTVEEAVNSIGWGLKYYGNPDLRLTALRDTTPSIAFSIQSPANLHVTDPEDRHIGFDSNSNESIIEIPGAVYIGPETEPQVVWIPFALNGTYDVLLIGTAIGEYNLTISLSTSAGTRTLSELGTISTNQTITFPVIISGTDIIPEFPSYLILPLFMTATLLAVIVYRRKHFR